MKKFDIIIVGAGLFGSIIAKAATDRFKRVLVIDKRDHIGGNCFTKLTNGINVHMYGPHIFHTNNKEVWDYINLFADFNNFTYRPKVKYQEKIYSLPINLTTLQQLWGVQTPEEAQRKLDEVRVRISNPQNFEEYVLSYMGEEIYQKFIYGYTVKQWGKEPSKLPISIIKRVLLRLNYNDDYFSDRWQGIPIGGYTQIFHKLLDRSALELNCDFLAHRKKYENATDTIIYTGKIDEYFDYQLGELEYISLDFEHEEVKGDYQGVATVNYSDLEIPYTRMIEHKHFEFLNCPYSIISKEFPSRGHEAYYPINDDKNNALYLQYKELPNKVIFGGRLGSYHYSNMDETILSALELTKKLF
jgi:UDP-galactopyranose mutase